jgi:hypothetical protein
MSDVLEENQGDAARHDPAVIASALAALRRRSRERMWEGSARFVRRRSGASSAEEMTTGREVAPLDE